MEELPRILIVDDDPIVHQTLDALLSRQGYSLVFASNGEEGLQKAREIEPDLILLDVMMPGTDGFKVCQRLRADPSLSQIPVLMLTGLDDQDSRIRGIESGADDFVGKPFNWSELRARVRTITWLSRQRRLHARELQAERDRTRAILHAVGEAVIVADLGDVIQYANPAAASLTGYSHLDLLGQKWSLLLGQAQSSELIDDVHSRVHSGQAWRGEVEHRRRNGETYDAMLTVAPLLEPGHSGAAVGFVSIHRDITPLKEADRLKDQFVSNVSHELSTPLSVIMLVAENLDALYDQLSDSRRKKMIRDLRRHTQVLSSLVDDVLEMSRLDSRRVSAQHDLVDISELLSEEAAKQGPLALQKRLSVTKCVQEPVFACANPTQIARVVRNLLSNAIKYTPDGGKITCECRAWHTQAADPCAWPGYSALPLGRWVGVRVTDTGVGIEAQHLPHVFERFYRVQPQGTVRGTGLGLSIAKELIELHGGRMAASSTPGRGSTFAFYLPVETAQEDL